MHILVTGANGYIGTHVVARLLQEGYEVTCAVRHPEQIQQQFPDCRIILCDFNHDTDVSVWQARLKHIDAVVNCVGILQQHYRESITAVHDEAPHALFTACQIQGIKKVIHLSALGVEHNLITPYAKTKTLLEEHLMQLDIGWIILKPSMVYGEGSYGGTSLFRGFAGLPWLLPIVGKGEQKFQPIYMQDLTEAICRLLKPEIKSKLSLTAVGPQQISVRDFLLQLRQWLGFKKSKPFSIPVWFVRIGAKIADWIGIRVFNSTAFKMLLRDNVATAEQTQNFFQTIGFTPRDIKQAFLQQPSGIQDRWFARLYFLKPLLRIGLAITWIAAGLITLFSLPEVNYRLLMHVGITDGAASFVINGVGLFDLALGVATLLNWRIRTIASVQLITILVYTLCVTAFLPDLWLDPFGAIIKSIPMLLATLIMISLAEDR